jgi:hypothetical protein
LVDVEFFDDELLESGYVEEIWIACQIDTKESYAQVGYRMHNQDHPDALLVSLVK